VRGLEAILEVTQTSPSDDHVSAVPVVCDIQRQVLESELVSCEDFSTTLINTGAGGEKRVR